jgi:hypothetical protein
MADLLVHYAVSRTAALGSRSVALGECLLLGAVLPDVFSKPFDLVLRWGWATTATHAPLTWAAMAYVLAHLFREPLRPVAFLGLLVGGWLHLAVDLLRDTMGGGAISLAFPFGREMYEVGRLYYSEDTLRFAPWAIGVVALAEAWTWWRAKRARRNGDV